MQGLTSIFGLAIFCSSFLLFQVQPILGKKILPWFGGVPAVWTTCMLFFQGMLVLGYFYAHLLSRKLSPKNQALVHLLFLIVSLFTISILPGDNWKPTDSDQPISAILLLLIVHVGICYVALAATAPLLQNWFGTIAPDRSPYRLYALSNVASLLALLSYPFVIEPNVRLPQQELIWQGIYALYVLSTGFCARMLYKSGAISSTEISLESAPPVLHRTRILWFLFPFFASVLLLAVTNELSQDVSSVPFLWIAPLSVYLLSFIICFDRPNWYKRFLFVPASFASLYLLTYSSWADWETTAWWDIGIWSLVLFFFCMLCHGELVRLRPHVKYLTSFYLTSSIAGAAGGVFVGVGAPRFFDSFTEIFVGLIGPIVLLTALAFDALIERAKRPSVKIFERVIFFMLLGVLGWGSYQLQERIDGWDGVIAHDRNFYGMLRVETSGEEPAEELHSLMNGRIIHGAQYVQGKKKTMPLTYYAPTTGLALAFNNFNSDRPRRIGVLGLGAGTIAAFGKAGDTVKFYEINRLVTDYAHAYFSYLSDSPAEITIVPGDGRLSLENEPPQNFDILVLDAFSGDAIPIHLLTVEAFQIYFKHLGEKGLLLINTSNRFIDLTPVVYGMAQYFNLSIGLVETDEAEDEEFYDADWMILTHDKEFLKKGVVRDELSRIRRKQRKLLWTDDYASLMPLLMED